MNTDDIYNWVLEDNNLKPSERKPSEEQNLTVVNVNDFITMDLPKREMILTPWLPAQGLAMIYAPRGIGKTHVALGVGYAIASNTSFLGWKSVGPKNILYLDGEMPASLMKERLSAIIKAQGSPLLSTFQLITPDLQKFAMPDLATSFGQTSLEPYLKNIELIIVDNISTLCRSSKENEADSWLPVQEWALKMRAAGKSVLFIHHAGKGGAQRGTSKREDILDTVISLKRPDNYRPKDGAVFEVHFEKARGFLGDEANAFQAKLVTHANGAQQWLTNPLESSSYEQVVQLASKGHPQQFIAKQLDIHKSNVSRYIKRGHHEGKIN
jgi:hypothetical protein